MATRTQPTDPARGVTDTIDQIRSMFADAGFNTDHPQFGDLSSRLDGIEAAALAAAADLEASARTLAAASAEASTLADDDTAGKTRLRERATAATRAQDAARSALRATAERADRALQDARAALDAAAAAALDDRARAEETARARAAAEEEKAVERAEAEAQALRRGATTMATQIRDAIGGDSAGVSEDLIAVLEDNLNGSALASDAEVAAGYIDLKDYFHYHADTEAEIPRAEGADGDRIHAAAEGTKLPVSFLQNLALNCHFAKAGRNLTDSVFLMCYIKTLIAYSGTFQPSPQLRCVHIDEYKRHTSWPADFRSTMMQMAKVKAKPQVSRAEMEIRRNIHRIIGTSVHIFRTRNHHWTDSAQDFVQRTWSAAWNGEAPEWDIAPEQLFRLSLHCFGMKPLNDYCERAYRANVMPQALVIRRTAARAGTAPVRLVDAALQCMKAEPFYHEVAASFGEEISAISAHVNDLKTAGDAAHVNQWFMCGAAQRADYREDIAEPLMPIAVAYIQSLGRNASLKAQVALNKRVSNHAALVDVLKDKFIAYRNHIFENTELVELLRRYRAVAVEGPAAADATPAASAAPTTL